MPAESSGIITNARWDRRVSDPTHDSSPSIRHEGYLYVKCQLALHRIDQMINRITFVGKPARGQRVD